MQLKKKLAIIGIITVVLAILGFVIAEMTYMKYNTNDPYSGLNEVIVEKKEVIDIDIDAAMQLVDELSEDIEIPKKPKLDRSIKKKEVRKYTKKPAVTNKMSSINGIQVSAGGEFDVAINGIDFHILSVYVYCPNHNCSRHHNGFGEFNWSCLMGSDNDYLNKTKCDKCGTEYDYSCIDWIRYNCPVCGDDDCYTRDDHNFCRNCGTDMRPYHKILLNNKWESR